MQNNYKIWQYILIFTVVFFAFIYALPNLYQKDPSLKIKSNANTSANEIIKDVTSVLGEISIDPKYIKKETQNSVIVALNNQDDQLYLKTELEAVHSNKYSISLNLLPSTPKFLNIFNANALNLGLDLQGGVHFLMELDNQTVIKRAKEQLVSEFKTLLKEEKLRGSRVLLEDEIIIRFRKITDREIILIRLEKDYPNIDFQKEGDLAIKSNLTSDYLVQIKEYALSQNLITLRNRVNELGVSEPAIIRQGIDRIVVELPGLQDTTYAKEILGATATLEFRLLDTQNTSPGIKSEIIYDQIGIPNLVEKEVLLTGTHIIDATSSFDEYGRAQVNIKLDSLGGNLMARISREHIGKAMVSVFSEYKPDPTSLASEKLEFIKQDKVINVATIQSRLGRSFRITGIDNPSEASNLALLLRAGALVAPMQIVEERTIGPSLGADNIKQGMLAIICGFLLVVFFMIFYYKKFGIVAAFALVINLVLIIALMSLIPGATLTLPGMAGILLTVGMAVDANVLIFERIKEELRAKKSVQKAIYNGYANALSTISDANITTFFTALILFAIGTGPIKGFALTLMLGIITSMFSAIIVSRAFVNLFWGKSKAKTLSI